MFNVGRSAIVKHINNIYNDAELEKNSTCSILEQVQLEGNRKVTRKREYYNLDMIISIGFRVNSKIAIKFRTLANKLIKEENELVTNWTSQVKVDNIIKSH